MTIVWVTLAIAVVIVWVISLVDIFRRHLGAQRTAAWVLIVLILVGSMMVRAVTEINWRYMGDAIPAFLTIAIMPFSYSIADGLIAGICSYIAINTLVWAIETASMGRLKASNKHEKEPWTWRIPGGLLPGWLTRLAQGKKDFWRPYDSGAESDHNGGNSGRGSAAAGEVTDFELAKYSPQGSQWVKPGEPLEHNSATTTTITGGPGKQ
jgi:adenine/guanine/hypoxanthine permease